MVVSVVAMSVAFIPVAADNDSPVEAERSFAEDTIEPGDEIEVEVEIEILDDDVTALDMIDEVEPEVLEEGSSLVDLQIEWGDDDPVPTTIDEAGVSGAVLIFDDHDWEAGVTFTVPYTLNTSPDMSHGDELVFSSASEVDGEEFEIDGPDTVTVEEDDPDLDPADFQLSDLEPADEEVTEGADPIDYSVEVENVGEETGAQDIDLEVLYDDDVEYSDTIEGVELDAEETDTLTFEDVEVEDLDPGTYTVEVSSVNDTIDTSLTVTEEPDAADLQLDDLVPEDEEVIEGADPITYEVWVQNLGDETGEQDIQLTIGDDIEETVPLELPGGADETVIFDDVSVGDLDPGEYTVEASSENDSIETSLTVSEEPEAAHYQLSDLEPADEEVTEGADPIDYSVDVENVGEEPGDQDIDIEVLYGDDVKYSDTIEGVELDAEETDTLTFEDVEVEDLDPGTYTVEVSSANETIDTSLTVMEEPDAADYQLSDLDPEELSIIQNVDDDPEDVSVTVENVGDESGDQTIELVVVNETDYTVYTDEVENVEIDGGESETIVFEDVPVDELDVGDYTHTVSSANDSVSGEISVIDEEPFLDDELPGLGPVAALIAMLLAAGFVRRRR